MVKNVSSRHSFRALLFALATTTSIGLAWANPSTGQPDAEVPVIELPVSQAVLFSSGVGYFEHRGEISGDAQLRLLFKSEQIDDVLKSMLLIDHGGGRISRVSYPANEPIARALASFGVDLSDDPSLSELLGRLRGTPIAIHAPDRITGQVFTVEAQNRITGDPPAQLTEHILTLWTQTEGLRSVPLSSINRIELLDEHLQRELQQALALLSSARDTDSRPVDVFFQGSGERQVQVGYLVENPVWKTSYRLDLSDLKTGGNDTALLQGWALVENTSDGDWNNIKLRLVSGRPLSFTMDLYSPIYLPRPHVELPLMAALKPPMYESGISSRDEMMPRMAMAAPSPAPPPSIAMQRSMPMAESMADDGRFAGARIDRSSTPVAAEAGSVGELFEFQIAHPVTLPRRRSAMLPIVQSDIAAERVSIYNASVHARNPLHGVRLTNSSGMTLLGGPITVFDGGTYAGDAQIDHLATDAERLLSYAVDLTVTVDSSEQSQQTITGAVINRGLLQLQQRTLWTHGYRLASTAAVDRMVIIEQPRHQQRTLVSPPEAWQSTPSLNRFRVSLPAGETLRFEVQEQQVTRQNLRLLDLTLSQLISYQSNQQISADVRKALQPAIDMQQEIQRLQRRISELQQQRQQVVTDQGRIRDNLTSVGSSSPLGQRYLRTLGQQEDELANLSETIATTQTELETQRDALSRYLNQLEIGG